LGDREQILVIELDRVEGPPDARIWLMDDMKNARLSGGAMRIKNLSPPIILRRRLKTKAILSIAGIAAFVGPLRRWRNKVAPQDRAAEHPS
jgi:hypothetical protein